MTTRVLVAAASKHGSTAEIARAIGNALAKHGIDVTVADLGEVAEPAAFDAFVLGSGVYGGSWLKPAKEFITRNAPILTQRPVWLFSSGPIGDPPRPQEVPAEALAMITVSQARDHRVFAGRMERDGLSLPERAIATVFRATYGDFRRWPDIQAWADEIGAALTAVADAR